MGLHISKESVRLEYHLLGTVYKNLVTLPIQDFLQAVETYARFLNKHLKARHVMLDWGKEEVAIGDKALKTYFKNKKKN